MDQTGALIGPLAVAGVLAWRGHSATGFAWAFALLAVPAVVALAILFRARALYPDPHALDKPGDDAGGALGPRYRLYLAGVALSVIALADWPLLAYHLELRGVSRRGCRSRTPAMGLDGLVALIAGSAFDRSRRRGGTGAGVLAAFVLRGRRLRALVLRRDADTPWLAIGGITLWSIARSAVRVNRKSLIAAIVPPDQRGRATACLPGVRSRLVGRRASCSARSQSRPRRDRDRRRRRAGRRRCRHRRVIASAVTDRGRRGRHGSRGSPPPWKPPRTMSACTCRRGTGR